MTAIFCVLILFASILGYRWVGVRVADYKAPGLAKKANERQERKLLGKKRVYPYSYGHREIGDPEYQGDVEREFKDLYSATVMFWPVSGLLYGSRAADAAWEKHDPYRVQKLEARIAELEKMTRTGSM